MVKHKKHHKAHRMRRNAVAAPSRPIPRAVVVRPRGPSASNVANVDDDTRGWRMIKALGGAAATTVAGAYLARQDTLPPKLMTGIISGLGAALALGAPNKTVRSVGLGAMAAAGGQLGFMLIDDELIRRADEKDHRPSPSPKPISMPATATKKPSNASDIPADALARAYERARLRMALASDAPN
jgi:hypothetical protein